MDLKKLHQKISSNISSENYAQTGHFTQEIKDLLQQDLKIKRSKLDKMSTRQKKKTKKFQTIEHVNGETGEEDPAGKENVFITTDAARHRAPKVHSKKNPT